ncbi:unnamed protein product [Prorocentrum cordatum]|nr:unnamed protein product [Polarella glacialis]
MLGEGAYGVVYAARHREAGTTVAVKLVDKVETPIDQIKREAELMQAVQHHECIVRFHGVFFEQCFACIVMDKYSGGALIDGLHRHMRRKGNLECFSVVHISLQMATALCYIHGRNIAHRDVKGDNFLMDRKDIADPECRIALTDFGSSTYVRPGERFSDEVGTRRFWAPEILRGDYGQKVDVWAMGVTMYGLLKGSFPFRDDEETRTKNWELNFPKVDPTCRDFLRAMLARDEGARASSDEVMAHRWLDGGRGAGARRALWPPPPPCPGGLPPGAPGRSGPGSRRGRGGSARRCRSRCGARSRRKPLKILTTSPPRWQRAAAERHAAVAHRLWARLRCSWPRLFLHLSSRVRLRWWVDVFWSPASPLESGGLRLSRTIGRRLGAGRAVGPMPRNTFWHQVPSKYLQAVVRRLHEVFGFCPFVFLCTSRERCSCCRYGRAAPSR